MSTFGSTKAKRVLAAPLRLGWREKARSSKGGSHRQLVHSSLPEITWAFHDGEEIGPKMLARIAKRTGLRPGDLQGRFDQFFEFPQRVKRRSMRETYGTAEAVPLTKLGLDESYSRAG